MTAGMTWIGDNSIEIGAPYGDGSSVGDVRRALRRRDALGRGPGRRRGRDPARGSSRWGWRWRRGSAPDIVFTRPGGTAGLVLEWGSHVQDDDPRWGAPRPCRSCEPRSSTSSGWRSSARWCAIRSRRRAPRRGARHRRWSSTATATRWPDVPHCALDLGDCMLALLPGPTRRRRRAARSGVAVTSGRVASRSRLTVVDQGVAERALAPKASPSTTAPATGASCSSTGCRSRSCSPSSCFPAIRATADDTGGPMTRPTTNGCGRSSSRRPPRCSPWSCRTASSVRARMMPALLDELRSVRARSTPCAGSATRRATPARASCTAPWWHAPTARVPPTTARSSPSPARQRRVSRVTAPPISARPGADADRRASRTRATSW